MQRLDGIADLKGLWRRSLIIRADGTRDTTSRVRWLQGANAFVDLRQPHSLADLADRRSLDELSHADCARLATQEGFAGRLEYHPACFEWHRLIDFQPATSVADSGSLEWQGDVLVERGRDTPYVEHWHRAAAHPAPCAGVLLRDAATGTQALLLRVGDEFMYARDRSLPPRTQGTLLDCVGAADVHEARQLIDCEISSGKVADGFLIDASTLPYRVGRRLGHRLLDHAIAIADGGARGVAGERVWDIIGSEGELGSLQGPSIC